MADHPHSFSDLLKKFGPSSALAELIGVKEVTARMWRQRDNLPPEYWMDIVAAAGKKGLQGITLELLAELAVEKAKKPAQSEGAAA